MSPKSAPSVVLSIMLAGGAAEPVDPGTGDGNGDGNGDGGGFPIRRFVEYQVIGEQLDLGEVLTAQFSNEFDIPRTDRRAVAVYFNIRFTCRGVCADGRQSFEPRVVG